jgi:hypothetical protein
MSAGLGLTVPDLARFLAGAAADAEAAGASLDDPPVAACHRDGTIWWIWVRTGRRAPVAARNVLRDAAARASGCPRCYL